jgi:hypothetical protein
MVKPLIFWEQPLRVAGPGATANAVARLNAQFSAGRFGSKERLSGSLRGSRLTVWRATLLGRAGDVVEFDGEIRSTGEGTIIEGAVRYQSATKIQFAGLLVIGMLLTAAGVTQKLSETVTGPGLLGLGLFVTVVTVLWIMSSAGMRHVQVRFLEEKLGEIVAR